MLPTDLTRLSAGSSKTRACRHALGAPPDRLGIQINNIRIIREFARDAVILDAGVGTASDATIAMGWVDGVLMSTTIAEAQNPIAMAESMKLAVGRADPRTEPGG